MHESNELRTKLQQGRAVLGTWSIIPSTVVVDVISSAQLDFIVIDSEHGPINYETAQNMVMVCESRGVSPIMRVGALNEADILKALDIGVHGIHVPNVENKSDAEELVRYSKYPPLGERGFSPFTRAGNYSIQGAQTLTQRSNKNVMNVIHIEGVDAFENIDEILSVEAVDVVFVGLFDLSKALGKPGKVDDPEVLNYLERVVKRISSSGKYAGTIAVSLAKALAYVDMGVQYITYLVDCEVLGSAYRNVKEEFHKQQ